MSRSQDLLNHHTKTQEKLEEAKAEAEQWLSSVSLSPNTRPCFLCLHRWSQLNNIAAHQAPTSGLGSFFWRRGTSPARLSIDAQQNRIVHDLAHELRHPDALQHVDRTTTCSAVCFQAHVSSPSQDSKMNSPHGANCVCLFFVGFCVCSFSLAGSERHTALHHRSRLSVDRM